MSYRSIKRVLGESSLERKCRFLFGVCLLILFGGAFFAADRVAERLVVTNTRNKAHDMVSLYLVNYHLIGLAESHERYREFKGTAENISRNAGLGDVNGRVLALEGMSPRIKLSLDEPNEDDQEMLESIARQLQQLEQLRAESDEEPSATEYLDSNGQLGGGDESFFVPPDSLGLGTGFIFAERRPYKSGEYHYYEPVVFSERCVSCHIRLDDTSSELDRPAMIQSKPDIYVVKLELPDERTQEAINWIRAILISVAIVTVFLAMLTSYVIVRYVIVKPLKHLRDVSDQISHGETEVRAHIRTGDEFEELAASFNRMLRHLIDTQQELRSVNWDLDANVDELAQLNMRLYEMNQLKGEFLANMSHELRTPLNSIIGFSEVLSGIDTLNDKQRRYAENIRKSGRLLLDMINDILDLAKIDAGKMDVKPTEFRIDGVIRELCDMVRSLAEEKNIDLQVNTDPHDPPLFQDQVKIQQILTNLLSNAIKFTPEGGRITISARRNDAGKLELSVRDTGVGIAEEDRAIVFEKFRQGTAVLGHDNLTREYSGTGLGLSIVKELCRLLGGEVSVESEVGKGSIFTVTLPWQATEETHKESYLATRLDELTRPKRIDFERAKSTPPVRDSATVPVPDLGDT